MANPRHEPTPEGYRRYTITAVTRHDDGLTIEYAGRIFGGIIVAELPPGILECLQPGTDIIVRTHTAETGAPGAVAHMLIPHPTEEGWAEIYEDF